MACHYLCLGGGGEVVEFMAVFTVSAGSGVTGTAHDGLAHARLGSSPSVNRRPVYEHDLL